MDDPTIALEEERLKKEAADAAEFKDTICIDERTFFSGFDFTGKGKIVHPSGKQTKEIQTMAQSFRVILPKSKLTLSGTLDESQMEYYDEQSLRNFDLMAKPRIYLGSGFVNKQDTDSKRQRFSRRGLFFFNDVILITNPKKEGSDISEIQQILWLKDLRINVCEIQEIGNVENDGSNPNPLLPFELIIAKTRNRPGTTILFQCDNAESKEYWLKELQSVLLAYHRETDLAKQLGTARYL